ncbi:Ger(x)C family spore germination protein [Paenibacillus sp. MMS20-IR301]|uniref:Ger(x)C family spore germination protein n=1 Tax=Paenibacillus sp. MMS20-IR301 TaxID=2895946 RepID=UPI0028E86963|nr:Ger(x)C family spore germination protein [Paenibacillus sp. MMS20-IR301]WNS41689.1 Ger(x)C family spore germination protein [Paenibacillus sp. MMS20-IR301]
MKNQRRLLLVPVVLLLLFCLPGCWNYSEVDDMSIVAGVAIDRNQADGKLLLTAEIVDTNGGTDRAEAGVKVISLSGDTMFEIVRNMISLTGKKLFWSHAKCIIISEELAREGLVKVVDWYSRDTETRSDVFIFVSGGKTAREILKPNSKNNEIVSFELAQIMRDEKFTSSAPVVEIWDFIDKLETSGNSAIAPMVHIHERDGGQYKKVEGTAIFVKDRMVGRLDGEESKSMLVIKNALQGGVIAVEDKHGKPAYSLEVISNQTKVKPSMAGDELQIQIKSLTKTGLDEVMNADGFLAGESIDDIEARAGRDLQEKLLAVIHKIQREYDADICGFGEKIHENNPGIWKKVKGNWPQRFAEMDVTVSSKVVIQSTAKTSRAIRLGD